MAEIDRTNYSDLIEKILRANHVDNRTPVQSKSLEIFYNIQANIGRELHTRARESGALDDAAGMPILDKKVSEIHRLTAHDAYKDIYLALKEDPNYIVNNSNEVMDLFLKNQEFGPKTNEYLKNSTLYSLDENNFYPSGLAKDPLVRPGSTLPTGSGTVAKTNASLAAAAKKPLIQPDKADFLPQQMVNGRSVNKVPSAMSVEELVDRRAQVYDKLLDPEYANVHPNSTAVGAMHTVDRGTIGHIDTELAKRGEDISMLPDAPAYDPDYVPGSGKRAPYLRSIAAVEVDNLSAAVISAAPTPPAAPPAAAAVASAVASAAPVPPAAAVAAVAASAAVITSAAPAPPVAPVAAVADAVVSSGASGATAAGSAVAAATATSSKVINIGKKIAMNPKTKIAAAVAVAGGIIGFRCCQKN